MRGRWRSSEVPHTRRRGARGIKVCRSMRTESRRNHARGNTGLTLDARLYVSLTASEYTGSLYVGTSPSLKKETPLHRIGTITAPTALYGITHLAGNEVARASSLRQLRRIKKFFKRLFIFVDLSNCCYTLFLIN